MADVDPETLLEWLSIGHGDERDMQLIALEQLCMLLLMSDNVDRCFENYPPRSFLPALCRIFLDEGAPDNVLEVTARAITYYLDVSAECTRRIVSIEGAVKAVCNRLALAEIGTRTSRDLAEQCIKVLELICTREAGAVFDASGLQCVLSFIRDNGSAIHKDTLHSAMSVITRLCSKVETFDQTLPVCIEALSALLKHEDTVVADSALRCFASLSDRFSRKAVDPAPLAEHGLIDELLNRLSNSVVLSQTSSSSSGSGVQNANATSTTENKSSATVSTLISLLSTLCRGSPTITHTLLRLDLPGAIEKALKGDERCVIDCMRLIDLLLVLLFDGRSAINKQLAIPHGLSGGWTTGSLASTSFPRLRRCESTGGDKSYRQLIDFIRSKDCDSLIEAIESNSMDVNYIDDVGQTLLNWSAAFGTQEMVEFLCDKGADTNKGLRSSSLHYAACFGRPQIAKALLRYGANPDLRDEDGKTPLDKARERMDDGHREVAAILQSPGEWMLCDKDKKSNNNEPDEACEPKGDPEMAPVYLRRMLPVFCSTFQSTMLPGIRKASLCMIRKMIHYIQAPLLTEICAPDSPTYNLGTMLVDVIANVLDNEDDEDGHVVVLHIIQDLMLKCQSIFLDHFARVGVFYKVQQLATSINKQLLQSEDGSPVDDTQDGSDAKEILQGKPYVWRNWCISRGRDCTYIWSAGVALELSHGSNGWFRFVINRKLSTMYSSGSPEEGTDSTENRSEFVNKLLKVLTSVSSTSSPQSILSRPGSTRIVIGNWSLTSRKECELTIHNNDGTQMTILHEGFNGFHYESNRGTKQVFAVDLTGPAEFDIPWVTFKESKQFQYKADAVKVKILTMANEIYEKYFKVAQLQPRSVVAKLGAIVAQIDRACQKQYMANGKEKGTQWKEMLQSALQDLKRLLIQDDVVSSYEIHSSGLVQSLLALLSTTVWDQGVNPNKRNKLQKQRIRMFRNVFKNENKENANSADVLVHKLISVLESIEKLPVYTYDPPGSGFGLQDSLQALTRRLRFRLQKGSDSTSLVDRTGRSLKMEPLSTVGQLERYMLKMVAKQWYDNHPSTFAYVLKVNESSTKLTFKHHYDFDENGIIYWIGTNGKTNLEWVNPATYGLVQVTCSDGRSLPYGRPEDILSRDTCALNCHTNDDKNAWFKIDLGLFVVPTRYTLRHARGYTRSALRNWNFEVSQDGTNWLVLYEHKNDVRLSEPGSTASWDLSPPSDEKKGWRHVRIAQRGRNASGQTHYLSLSGFEIYGTITEACEDIGFPDSDANEVDANVPKPRTDRYSDMAAIVPVNVSSRTALSKSRYTYTSKLLDKNVIANMLSRKANSTPSLSESNEQNKDKASVASTDQAASADNLAAKQAAMEITESVVSVARSELASVSSSTNERNTDLPDSSGYFLMQLKDPDMNNANKDLSTILETYVSGKNTFVQAVNGSGSSQRTQAKEGGNTYVVVDVPPNASVNSTGNKLTRLKMKSIRGIRGESLIPLEAYEMYERWRGSQDYSRNGGSYLSSADYVIPNTSMGEASSSAEARGETLTRAKGARFVCARLRECHGKPRLKQSSTDGGMIFPSSTNSSTASSVSNSGSVAASNSGSSSINFNQAMISFAAVANDEQVSLEDFLDNCRGPTLMADSTLMADFDDEDHMHEDDNDDDGNEDDDDYEEVMVSRNLLRFMEDTYETRNIGESCMSALKSKRRCWDDEYVLKRQFSALIPAFDPRPGRININQTTDLEIQMPPDNIENFEAVFEEESTTSHSPKLKLTLRAQATPGGTDIEIPLNDENSTIFQAIQELLHKMELASRAEKLRKIWETVYTIIYEESKDTPSTSRKFSQTNACGHGSVTTPTTPEQSMSCTVEDVLQLLRHLFVIYTRPENESNLYIENVNVLLPEEFASKKVTNKLLQQIQDPLVLSSGALPAWCEELNRSCPFLFPFETRQLFFSCTAFGPSRSIVWLQSQRDATSERQRLPTLSPRREDTHEFRVGRLKHERIKVPRNEELLSWARQAMRAHADRKSILEVEFVGEQGTGLGPTLEFYALISAELQRRDLGIWLCDDDELLDTSAKFPIDLGEGLKPPGYYVRRPSGLFPAPLPQNSVQCDNAVKHFWFLGIFLAKVLQDNRLVDLPLSTPFLKVLCQGDIHTNIHERIGLPAFRKSNEDEMVSSFISEESEKEFDDDQQKSADEPWFSGILQDGDLQCVDPIRYKFLQELRDLVVRKSKITYDNALSLEAKTCQIQNLSLNVAKTEARLEDLGLSFTYSPSSRVFGFSSVDLVKNGTDIDVTVDNVEEYIDLSYRFCLETGIRRQMEALRDGFSRVFSLNKLSAFTPNEIRLMLCGDQNPHWTREDLLNYTEPKLGYTKDSPGFLRFVNVLLGMSAGERKSFLQFTTGCSSLPPGGLANLYPRLTVVRKVDAGEGSYPSVNTCVHYLKLPDYPTEEMLRDRLLTATMEKGFHLN